MVFICDFATCIFSIISLDMAVCCLVTIPLPYLPFEARAVCKSFRLCRWSWNGRCGQSLFVVVFLIISTLISADLASNILYEGDKLVDVQQVVIVFIAVAVAMIVVPLFFFTRKLFELKRNALAEYGAFQHQVSTDFHHYWISDYGTGGRSRPPLPYPFPCCVAATASSALAAGCSLSTCHSKCAWTDFSRRYEAPLCMPE